MANVTISGREHSWVDPAEVEQVVVDSGATVTDLADAEAVIWLDSFNVQGLADELHIAPKTLRWIQLPWAGVEIFSEGGLFESYAGDVQWTCAKGAYAELVAEHALALTLACLRSFRRCFQADSWIEWKGFHAASLYRKNVLIIGGGGIGKQLEKLLHPFQTNTTLVRRTPSESNERSLADLSSLLPEADVVVLATPLTPETEKMLGEHQLNLMKDSAFLVNVGRGRLVDTDALVNALENESIAGAALDVTEPEPLPDGHPLGKFSNCLITPHVADPQELSRPYFLARVAENVGHFVNGESLVGVVDTVAGY